MQKLEFINFEIPKGSLYHLLARLKHQEMIAAYFEEMDTGSTKRCLDLTENGQQRLKELRNYWRKNQSPCIQSQPKIKLQNLLYN